MPTIRGLLLAAAWCAAGPGAFGQPLGELPATPGVIPAPPPEPAERTVPPELEPFEGRPVRVITLRAVAPLEKTIPLLAHALKGGTRALLYKGPDVENEIAQAGEEARKRRIQVQVVERYQLPEGLGSRSIVQLSA